MSMATVTRKLVSSVVGFSAGDRVTTLDKTQIGNVVYRTEDTVHGERHGFGYNEVSHTVWVMWDRSEHILPTPYSGQPIGVKKA